MADIHPTAIIAAGAQLAGGVTVGPYSVVGADVTVGEGTSIAAHCVVEGRTRIGRDNRIFQFCSLGAIPQDKKYAGESTELQIGDRNTIREFCSFNTGTAQDGGVTRIGNDNWIMAYVHIAHDVQLGDQTVLANSATLAGHVEIGDWAIIGGLSGIHQFCKVGAHVMTGFQSHVSQDIPPFMTVSGNPLTVHGINAEGLRRRGFSAERIARVKQMHRLLYRDGLTLAKSLEAIAALDPSDADGRQDIAMMVGFLAGATRGIVR